jgi:hypothetical protein
LIESQYAVSRDSLYRHAHALDLFSKRRKNLPMALDKIIERVDVTQISGSVILSAIKAHAKISGAGQAREPVQTTEPKKLFEQMSPEERRAFAQDGSLPKWFPGVRGTTGQAQEEEKAGEVTETQKLQ